MDLLTSAISTRKRLWPRLELGTSVVIGYLLIFGWTAAAADALGLVFPRPDERRHLARDWNVHQRRHRPRLHHLGRDVVRGHDRSFQSVMINRRPRGHRLFVGGGHGGRAR